MSNPQIEKLFNTNPIRETSVTLSCRIKDSEFIKSWEKWEDFIKK